MRHKCDAMAVELIKYLNNAGFNHIEATSALEGAAISNKVLLVDDDDAVRTMMSLTLVHKGFEVASATNVRGFETDHDAALRCADHRSPHAQPQ